MRYISQGWLVGYLLQLCMTYILPYWPPYCVLTSYGNRLEIIRLGLTFIIREWVPYLLLTEKVVPSYFYIINQRLCKKTWEKVRWTRWEVTSLDLTTSNLFPILRPDNFLFPNNPCSKRQEGDVRLTWLGWINLGEGEKFFELACVGRFPTRRVMSWTHLFDVTLN